jgi:excisionase family DNA binding protein
VTDRLLTARQVADRLGITAETVLRWTRRGDLPGFRLPGGALRFGAAELDAWLDAHATGATGRGGESHHDGRAHGGAYAGLSSEVRATTPPPEAATTEEDT